MENTRKERNASLELLRIICMFFIILHHYAVHGGYLIDASGINNYTLIQAISFGGKLACAIFILITGYFLINSKFNYKKVIKLIAKVTIYDVLIALIVYGFNIKNFSISECIKELIPIFFGPWFIVNYIILYFISPFLNKMLKSLDKSSYKKLIIIILLIWSLIPTITKNAWTFSNLDGFIVMYIIGAYLRLYTNEETNNNNNNLKIAVLGIFLMILSIIWLNVLGNIIHSKKIIDNAGYFTQMNSILTVLTSIYVFIYFKNKKFINKTINYIASSMLGVYIIHDDNILRRIIWWRISPNVYYMNSNYLLLHIIIKCILIFIICVIIDKIFEKILNFTVYKWIDDSKFFYIIESKVDCLSEKV